MKILFFSDIHGIYDNLKYLKKVDERENFDKVIVLGDMYYNYGRETKDKDKIVDFLNGFNNRIIGVRGNCDNNSDIKLCKFKIFDSYSNIRVDGLDIYFTHGNTYNYDNNIFSDGVLVYGHEHYPYIKKDSDMTYINVGSISLPRYNSNPSYLIYNNREFIIYDIYNNIIDRIKL